MSLAIHMGIMPEEIGVLEAQMYRLLPPQANPDTPYIEPALDIQGDTWFASEGEPALHVVYRTVTPMVDLNLFVNTFPSFLMPRGNNNLVDDTLVGVKLFVTDSADFSEEYIELRYPG